MQANVIPAGGSLTTNAIGILVVSCLMLQPTASARFQFFSFIVSILMT